MPRLGNGLASYATSEGSDEPAQILSDIYQNLVFWYLDGNNKMTYRCLKIYVLS